ncbi:MAG: hypothetical protein AAF738_11965, partial [Bacteroidota bacterium]
GYEFTARPEQGMDKYKAAYVVAERYDDRTMLAQLDLKMGDINQVNELLEVALRYYKSAVQRLDRYKIAHYNHYYQAQYDLLNVRLKMTAVTSIKAQRQVCDSISSLLQEVQALKLKSKINKFERISKLCGIRYQDNLELLPLEVLRLRYKNNTEFYYQTLLNGKIALEQNKYTRALEYATACKQLGEAMENIDIISNALSLKRDIYLAKKDYSAAYTVMENMYATRGKLMEEKRMRSIYNLEKRLEIAEKTNEILRLNQQKSMSDTRAKIYQVAALSLAALLALMLFFIVRSKQQQRTIQEQNIALSKQKQSLERLAATKDKLLAIISHDLKNTALVFQSISKKVNYLLDKGRFQVLRQLASEMDTTAYDFQKML